MPMPDGKTYERGNWVMDEALLGDAGAYLADDYDPEFGRDYFEAYVEVLNQVKKHGTLPANSSGALESSVADFFQSVPKDKTRLQEAAKNMMIQSAYDINSAVENIMTASRPVDMDAPRKASEKSDRQWNAKQLTQDNFMAIPMMIEENNAGKACTGIFAATMKVFYALSHVQNQLVQANEEYFSSDEFNGLTQSGKHNEFMDKMGFLPREYTLVGKDGKVKVVETNLTANINFDNTPGANEAYNTYLQTRHEMLTKHYGTEVEFEVIDVRKIDDTATSVLSALVSAATDNAKELILAKINASPDLANCYSATVIQGMSFEDIASFMTSPHLYKIVDKSRANAFTGVKSSVDMAISYYNNGPKVGDYTTYPEFKIACAIMASESGMKFMNLLSDTCTTEVNGDKIPLTPNIAKHYTSSKGTPWPMFIHKKNFNRMLKDIYTILSKQEGSHIAANKVNALIDAFANMDCVVDESTNLTEGIYDTYGKDYYLGTPLKRFVRDTRRWFNDISQPGFAETLATFEQIRKDAQCTTTLSNRLGINQGMKTDVFGHFAYNQKLTNYYIDLVLDMDVNSRADITDAIKVYLNRTGGKYSTFAELNLHEIFDVTQANHPDANVRNAYKDLMTEVESKAYQKYRVLDVEAAHPTFGSMIKTQNFAIEMFRKGIVRYDSVLKLAEKIRLRLDQGVKGYHSYNEQEFATISNFILNSMVHGFIANEGIKINTKAGDYIAVRNGNKVKWEESTADGVVDLSTAEGLMTFKAIMDKKAMELRADNPDNAFLENLSTDNRIDYLTGRKYSYVRINMHNMTNIKDSYSQQKYQAIVNGFDVLKTRPSEFGLKSLAEDFMLYNLIVNQNAFGSSSMTKVFESSLSLDQNNLIGRFMDYVGTLDALNSSLKDGKYDINTLDTDLLAMMMAPVRTRYSKKTANMGEYIKDKDEATGMYTMKILHPNVQFDQYGSPWLKYSVDNDGNVTGEKLPATQQDGANGIRWKDDDVYVASDFDNEVPAIFAKGVSSIAPQPKRAHNNGEMYYKDVMTMYYNGKIKLTIDC